MSCPMRILTKSNKKDFFEHVEIGNRFTYSKSFDFISVFELAELNHVEIIFLKGRLVKVVDNNVSFREKLKKVFSSIIYYKDDFLNEDVLNKERESFIESERIEYKDPYYYLNKKQTYQMLSEEAKTLITTIIKSPNDILKLNLNPYKYKNKIIPRKSINLYTVHLFLQKYMGKDRTARNKIIKEIRNAINGTS